MGCKLSKAVSEKVEKKDSLTNNGLAEAETPALVPNSSVSNITGFSVEEPHLELGRSISAPLIKSDALSEDSKQMFFLESREKHRSRRVRRRSAPRTGARVQNHLKMCGLLGHNNAISNGDISKISKSVSMQENSESSLISENEQEKETPYRGSESCTVNPKLQVDVIVPVGSNTPDTESSDLLEKKDGCNMPIFGTSAVSFLYKKSAEEPEKKEVTEDKDPAQNNELQNSKSLDIKQVKIDSREDSSPNFIEEKTSNENEQIQFLFKLTKEDFLHNFAIFVGKDAVAPAAIQRLCVSSSKLGNNENEVGFSESAVRQALEIEEKSEFEILIFEEESKRPVVSSSLPLITRQLLVEPYKEDKAQPQSSIPISNSPPLVLRSSPPLPATVPHCPVQTRHRRSSCGESSCSSRRSSVLSSAAREFEQQQNNLGYLSSRRESLSNSLDQMSLRSSRSVTSESVSNKSSCRREQKLHLKRNQGNCRLVKSGLNELNSRLNGCRNSLVSTQVSDTSRRSSLDYKSSYNGTLKAKYYNSLNTVEAAPVSSAVEVGLVDSPISAARRRCGCNGNGTARIKYEDIYSQQLRSALRAESIDRDYIASRQAAEMTAINNCLLECLTCDFQNLLNTSAATRNGIKGKNQKSTWNGELFPQRMAAPPPPAAQQNQIVDRQIETLRQQSKEAIYDRLAALEMFSNSQPREGSIPLIMKEREFGSPSRIARKYQNKE